MKRNAIYIQILFCVLFILLSLIFAPNASANLWQGLHDCVIYDVGWQINSDKASDYPESLPTFFYLEDDGQDIWLHRELTDVNNGDCLGFFSFQQQIRILLDGEEVYKFAPPAYIKSKTPGNKWHFMPLNADDNGKTLTIQIHQCYTKGRVTIPTMYYGSRAGITLNYLSAVLPRACLSFAMIFVGCLLIVFHLLKRKNTLVGDSLKWLALFALFRGLWSLIESNTYSFFISRLLLVSQVSYMLLKIAVVLYLQFLNETFHYGKNRALHILSVCSISEFFITFTLQFFGIADYANTVFITHILMLIAGLYTSFDVIRTLYKQHKDSSLVTSKRRYSYTAQLLCTFIIVLTSVIDMGRYYATNSPDVARFSRIGDFIYVLIMSFSLFLDFVYLLKMGQKAAIIREEASIDPMTKLGNRSSFEKDIARGNKRTQTNKSIVILDLNNLKLFNDQKGHDVGDLYIITAGSIIHDIFAPYGRAYRIGGDEFCVIAKNLSYEQFLTLRDAMEAQIRSQNEVSDTLPMEIASGYATFDATQDNNLHDTMKRADEEMYRRKEELKTLQ